MQARHRNAKLFERRRRWGRVFVAVVLLGVGGSALTEATIRNRSHTTSTAAATLPSLPSATLLSPREVEAGLVTRLHKMLERSAKPTALQGGRNSSVVASIPTPFPLPRDLDLPPAALASAS